MNLNHVSIRGSIEGNLCRFIYSFTIENKSGTSEKMILVPVPHNAIPLEFSATRNGISKQGKPDFNDTQRCIYDDVLASGNCGILVTYGKKVGTQILIGFMHEEQIQMSIDFEMKLIRTQSALNLIFPALGCSSGENIYDVDMDIAKLAVKNIYSNNMCICTMTQESHS